MDQAKAREVIALYKMKFEEMAIPKEEFPKDEPHNRVEQGIAFYPSSNHHLAHCHKMLDWAEILVKMNRMREVHRVLGFIQGTLWMVNIYTLNEIESHNRMPGPWWNCQECGSQNHEHRNTDVAAREADIYCKSCGAFVREWNP